MLGIFIISLFTIIGCIIGYFIGENTDSTTGYIISMPIGLLLGFVLGLTGCVIANNEFTETTIATVQSYQIFDDNIQYIDVNSNIEVEYIYPKNINIIHTEEKKITIEISYGKILDNAVKITIYD